MKNLLKAMWPAYGWLLLCTLLLIMPGSAFPKETWLSKLYFDKWVHAGLFAVMVWLFCRGHYKTGKPKPVLKWLFVSVFIYATLFGVAIEFVQKNFIPNRSFEVADILADAGGALLGYIFSYFVYLRKKQS